MLFERFIFFVQGCHSRLIILKHLKNVIIVGLKLGILKGKVMELGVFLVEIALKDHGFVKKFALSFLSADELGLDGLELSLKAFFGMFGIDGIGLKLLFEDFGLVFELADFIVHF